MGTATTVGYGLSTGFDRAARDADLPDVVARFDREPCASLDPRVRALPNLAGALLPQRAQRTSRWPTGRALLPLGTVQIVLGGRRGYAITAGHDLRAAGRARS